MFYELVLKSFHSFVNCHSTLFKWFIFTMFEIYKSYARYFYL